MVQKFTAEINKVYFIEEYTLIHVLSGTGGIQVDFQNYYDWKDKMIYLEKGQYIKFLSDDFTVRKIEFPSELVFRDKDVRVLFKHLVSLGYINFNECEDCRKFLSGTVFSNSMDNIIDISSKQWFWQNPFSADKHEYQIIFDIKDVIDEQFANHLTSEGFTALINDSGYNAQKLLKSKIGLSIRALASRKRLIESKKNIVFSDKTIQEISFELGFRDPAYFSRSFQQQTGTSPNQFRNEFDYANRDAFAQNIVELLRLHHKDERSLEFYADKMHLSVKALSRKVRDKMSTSLGQLIRLELITTAKSMLDENAPIHKVAHRLGFDEAHHFSRFFKHYTGQTPTEYLQQ